MSTHFGAVRSFDLGGAGTAGRRWSARCSCGALATTGAWPDAMAFVTEHLKVTAQPRDAPIGSHATPDLRRVDCWRPVVVTHNGNGRTGPVSVMRRRAVHLLNALVRVVVSAQSFARG
jgi:hypothetical protein